MLQNLCTPALIYLIFSITQITIDIFRKDYNIALVKFTVAFIFTILLNYLCSSGLGIVSWIIVFIPFVLMTYVSMLLMYAFGFSENSILDTSNTIQNHDQMNQTDNTIETGKLHQRRLSQDKDTIESN